MVTNPAKPPPASAPGAKNSAAGTRKMNAPSVNVRLTDCGTRQTSDCQYSALALYSSMASLNALKEYTVCWKIFTTGMPRTYSVPALLMRSSAA